MCVYTTDDCEGDRDEHDGILDIKQPHTLMLPDPAFIPRLVLKFVKP